MSDWRRETARDVGFGSCDVEEWRGALRRSVVPVCPLGVHRMVRDGHGGGVCANCGETVSGEEL